jgi:hypothetical protein
MMGLLTNRDQRCASEFNISVQKCSPADGTNAAVNWRDYGRPRWQLADETIAVPDVLEGP